MATQAENFADARKCMVDSQIRPNRVTDPRVLAAMRSLPRERFLPAGVQALAYADEDVPLGSGPLGSERFLMEPMVFAKLLQAATLRENERVLVVGAGTGYGAAVLAACGCRVTALEEDPALLAMAAAVLPVEAPGVSLVSGPLAAGWPSQGPYDLILIEGAVPEIPSALANQVRSETGRIMAVIATAGHITQAVIAEATPFGLGISTLFDCATPVIPSLRRAPVFAF
ncbi:MAG TPA: protein-L-isoaspartate O-methyltransferase [Acetobacteraceae bacterium]|jgi:protein-L-isoaspartate(D-aspartate) O-methyltransferase|nr:protein-L-isoaspartate O-methyltransferase [Acetobacteraceae bacterium]